MVSVAKNANIYSCLDQQRIVQCQTLPDAVEPTVTSAKYLVKYAGILRNTQILSLSRSWAVQYPLLVRANIFSTRTPVSVIQEWVRVDVAPSPRPGP